MRKLSKFTANLTTQRPRRLGLSVVLTTSVVCGVVAIIARDKPNFTPKSLWHMRRQSTLLALLTLPDQQSWRRVVWVALPYFLIATLSGLATGFIRLEPVGGSRRKWITIPLSLLVLPGIIEELVFRVWLLPHPSEPVPPRRRWLGAVAALLTFVLAHPLNGLTISRRALPLFTDLAFLFQAALVGTACTLAYFISGSIWPPVLIHWLPVSIWILFLGGAKRVTRANYWTR